MAQLAANSDEPCTPNGRVFLRPKLDLIIHCTIGFKNQLNISCIKSAIASSLTVQHPRFHSVLVVDENGVEHWRPTEIDIDRHIVLVEQSNNNYYSDSDIDQCINDYIADLIVSWPLSSQKPLWEAHILWAQNCIVFRIHHALGDATSLMSLLVAESRKGLDCGQVPNLTTVAPPFTASRQSKGWMEVLMGLFKMLFYSLVFCSEFLLRVSWVRDPKTVITGGKGVQLWPRKLVTATFFMDDFKIVKSAVPNATINDVLSGVISVGLSRYLEHWSPKSLKEGTRITCATIVNLRQRQGLLELSEMMKRHSTSPWGNKFGTFFLPIYYHKGIVNPLQHVRRVKKMIDRRKRSFVAQFSYKIANLVGSLLGINAVCRCFHQLCCNTTFAISNVVGPKQEIAIAENPITFVRINSSGVPHALTIHFTSYAERADMQILVAKDIIPDPEFLAKCFQDALHEMKQVAVATT